MERPTVREQEIGAGRAEGALGRVLDRRLFLGALAAIGSAGMAALCSVTMLRYLLSPLHAGNDAASWSDVGEASEFAADGVPLRRTIQFAQQDGWREIVSMEPVFVHRNQAGEFEVLSAICPHLGCTVAWQLEQDAFVCPCHGGRFAPDGQHLSGPPPRGMDRLPVRVHEGKLQVQFEFFRSDVPTEQKLS